MYIVSTLESRVPLSCVFSGMQEDDSSYADSDDGRFMSDGGSVNSDSSISAIMLDAAVSAETKDLAAQVGLSVREGMLYLSLEGRDEGARLHGLA